MVWRSLAGEELRKETSRREEEWRRCGGTRRVTGVVHRVFVYFALSRVRFVLAKQVLCLNFRPTPSSPIQPNPVSRVDMTSRSISQLLRTQMPPMARQRPLPTFPRHISLNWSRQSTAAFGLRGVSTETPASEEKVESTASTEEKAKTGAPPVAGTKEDSVAKLKEERDDLVVRLYLD